MQFDNFIWKKKSATSVQHYNKYDAHNLWGDDASDIKNFNFIFFIYRATFSKKFTKHSNYAYKTDDYLFPEWFVL